MKQIKLRNEFYESVLELFQDDFSYDEDMPKHGCINVEPYRVLSKKGAEYLGIFKDFCKKLGDKDKIIIECDTAIKLDYSWGVDEYEWKSISYFYVTPVTETTKCKCCGQNVKKEMEPQPNYMIKFIEMFCEK